MVKEVLPCSLCLEMDVDNLFALGIIVKNTFSSLSDLQDLMQI